MPEVKGKHYAYTPKGVYKAGKAASKALKEEKREGNDNPQFTDKLQSIVHLAHSMDFNSQHAHGHTAQALENYKEMVKHIKSVPSLNKHFKALKKADKK